jgi:small subunit ribosomal protein S3
MVIGRKGSTINALTAELDRRFNVENPQIEVIEAGREANLNAQIMATKLAEALERGWHFRRAGHSTVQRVMASGAQGCQVIVSGKLTGQRHRTEKFSQGHIKYCGETADRVMDVGFAVCKKKLGVIGCTVRVMRAEWKLPDNITILDKRPAPEPKPAQAQPEPEPARPKKEAPKRTAAKKEPAPKREAPKKEAAPKPEAPKKEGAPKPEAPKKEASAAAKPVPPSKQEPAPSETGPEQRSPAEEAAGAKASKDEEAAAAEPKGEKSEPEQTKEAPGKDEEAKAKETKAEEPEETKDEPAKGDGASEDEAAGEEVVAEKKAGDA